MLETPSETRKSSCDDRQCSAFFIFGTSRYYNARTWSQLMKTVVIFADGKRNKELRFPRPASHQWTNKEYFSEGLQPELTYDALCSIPTILYEALEQNFRKERRREQLVLWCRMSLAFFAASLKLTLAGFRFAVVMNEGSCPRSVLLSWP